MLLESKTPSYIGCNAVANDSGRLKNALDKARYLDCRFATRSVLLIALTIFPIGLSIFLVKSVIIGMRVVICFVGLPFIPID